MDSSCCRREGKERRNSALSAVPFDESHTEQQRGNEAKNVLRNNQPKNKTISVTSSLCQREARKEESEEGEESVNHEKRTGGNTGMGEEEAGKRVNGWIMAWAYPCSPRHGADGLAQASMGASRLSTAFLFGLLCSQGQGLVS